MRVSFCTVSMNRLHHIKRTILPNIADNPGAEFILLDYSSSDKIEEWVRENLWGFIRVGVLKFYQCPGNQYFRHSHSRNVVMKLATCEIICNVDADNFTGKNFDKFIMEHLPAQKHLVYAHEKANVSGRIALYKDDFISLGGYDEGLNEHWGFEDTDLIKRAEHLGFNLFKITDQQYLKAISHSHWERIVNTKAKRKPLSLYVANKNLSRHNRRQGKFIANVGKEWGKAEVIIPQWAL